MPAAAAWFSRVGLPLTPSDRAEVVALLRGHRLLAEAEMGEVDSWAEASSIVRAADWDGSWWDDEEAERERLWMCAAERLGENALLGKLTEIADALTQSVRDAAGTAAAHAGVAHGALIRAASGAALLAAQQSALASIALEGGTHFFTHKFALFKNGRWPLGLHLGRYVVF
ncbi:MAG: hypothetical protein H0X11_01520 [Betaproteobacteria bacterium]|nr:hypothetical protein [Betaproteobacteria bacterium]